MRDVRAFLAAVASFAGGPTPPPGAERGAAADPDLKGFGAFVINMDSQTGRLQGFREAMGRSQPWLLGALRRVPGVDGRDLLGTEEGREGLLQQKTISRHSLQSALDHASGAPEWGDLSPGAVGLYLSHARAWQEIVDRELRYGLIFEDDLRFYSPSFEPTLRSVLRGQTQADLAYLQHCLDSSAWPPGASEPEAAPSVVPRPRPVGASEKVPCLASYLLSRQGAERALREMFPVAMQLDMALSNASAWTGLRRIVFEPAVAQVGQESHTSSVQENSLCRRWGWRVVSILGMWSRHLFSPFCAI